MGRRVAKVLVPAFLVPLVLCVVLALLLWVMKPDARNSTTESSVRTNVVLPTAAPRATPLPFDPNTTRAMSDEQARIELYKRVGPAVVSIDTSNQAAGAEIDPTTLEQAQGSGFLVDTDGHIVTNRHVIEGAKSLYVTFSDGKQVRATLVGANEDNDIAVIKVDANEVASITPLVFGDSSQVQVGQDTIAIGNPFGLQNTMTLGIVSATNGRSLPGRVANNGARFQISRIIQTDAAVNPGNSGGPLLNSSGEVIGVNTAIRVTDPNAPEFAGVAYAVPANKVRVVAESLIATGEYKSAYLGVSMFELTPQLADTFDLPIESGVLITNIVEDGPAAKAGLRLGSDSVSLDGEALIIDSDIIVAFNGEPVRSSDDVIALINDSTVGDVVRLTILRDKQQIEVPVTLGERP
ncbi:MAG: trypsin-like peptidase domain-containing protein [Herpetosiphon sp.]|nr:trypsin-like peptidase domain-containing protein [Herpetosiphon sp.]